MQQTGTLLGLLDRRPVAAAAQHLDATAGDALTHHPDRLRRRNGVLVARDQQRRTIDPGRVGGPHVGERLARARVTLGVLAHERLANERNGDGPPRARFRGHAGAQQRVGDGLHVALTGLRGAAANGGPGRIGRSQ